MKFRPHAGLSPSPANSRPEINFPEEWLLPLLATSHSVVEFGGGSGTRAAFLLAKLPGLSHYEAFEPSAALAEQASLRLPQNRAQVIMHDPAITVPIPDANQDTVLTLDYLEFLRMDQLYMVAAEARRILRPNGLWVLRSLCPQEGLMARLYAWRLAKRSGCRALELTHYISPEDWRERARGTAMAQDGLKRQTLLLERT